MPASAALPCFRNLFGQQFSSPLLLFHLLYLERLKLKSSQHSIFVQQHFVLHFLALLELDLLAIVIKVISTAK
jgi:hypothetical protein